MFVIAYRFNPHIAIGASRYLTASAATDYLYRHYEGGRWGTPWEYIVRRATWQEREAAWFAHSVYQHPIWANEKFWRENAAVHAEHFAHISLEDPSMIAFTASAEHGERDRQTRMKPGKYLQKFFGDVLSPRKIAFYAEWFTRGQRPVESGTLAFADTEEEMIRVYDDGPASCMQGEDCVKVYAAGDLALAYMTSEERGVFARALCWPERKTFGRVYPTADRWDEDGFDSLEACEAARESLIAALKAQGYESLAENPSGFDGARLQAIQHPQGDDYMMPYVDGLSVEFHGDHFTLQRHGSIDADSTTGWISMKPEYEHRCGHCGDGCDDITVVHDGYENGRAFGAEYWCESCADSDRVFYCDATHEHYVGYETDRVESEDGDTWVIGWAEANAYLCALDNVWVRDTEAVHMASGDTWSKAAFEREGFTCAHDGQPHPRDEESETFPGFHEGYDDNPAVHPELELEAA